MKKCTGGVGIEGTAERVDCGMVDCTLRWYEHFMNVNKDNFARRVYESRIGEGLWRGECQ